MSKTDVVFFICVGIIVVCFIDAKREINTAIDKLNSIEKSMEIIKTYEGYDAEG